MYHVNVNVNLILENIIQIKSGIVINVDASAKNIKCLKNIFGILLHVAAKIVNIQQVVLTIQWLRLMKLMKKQKQFQQSLLKKSVKQEISCLPFC